MASPVDSARQGTNIATAATSHAINVGSPVAGTLLIVFVRFAAAPGTVTFTGYTQLAANTSDASDDDSRIYYRWADGAEGATDTLATTNSVKLAAICWEITGAANPATTAPSVSAAVVGTAANINPASWPPGTIDFSGDGGFLELGAGGGQIDRIAESFVSAGAVVTGVSAKLLKLNSPTDNLVLELQSNSGGTPSETVIGTVGSIAGSSLTGASTVYSFPCSIAVTNATTYWLVFRRDGASNATNTYALETAPPVVGNALKVAIGLSWGSEDSTHELAVGVFQGAEVRDYLFITVIGMDSETATATAPAGYANTASANSGTGGAVATNCMIWGASKQTTAVTSDDPGAWTSSAPNAGATAWTIAIPPPAAVAAAVVKRWRPSNQVAVMRPALR